MNGQASAPNGAKTCTVATKGESAVAQACARGGRPEARKLMKVMVKQASHAGQKFTCDGCHKDLDGFELTKNATADYEKLARFAKDTN